MNSKAVPFTLGLVLGGAAVTGYFLTRDRPSASMAVTPEMPSPAPAEAEAALAKSRQQIARLENDNLKLATRVQELMQHPAPVVATAPTDKAAKRAAPANPFAAMFGGDEGGTNEMAKAMKGMMQNAMKQQVEGKLGRMKAKLALSPEQEAEARRILEKQFGMGLEMSQKMIGGKATSEDMAEVAKQVGDPEAQLKALLTPEQQTAYAGLQQEERRNNARLVANSELIQMQGTLGLDQAQQDKVFQALYAQSERMLGGGAPSGERVGPAEVDQDGAVKPFKPLSIRDQFEQKITALKGVLTEEQLVRYREMQEQQLRMIEAFMPKDGKPGDAVIPNIQVLPSAGKP